MTDWLPIRKVGAALLTAIVAAPPVIAYLSSETNDFDWRGAILVIAAAIVPVLVAYLVPPAPMPVGDPALKDDPLLPSGPARDPLRPEDG